MGQRAVGERFEIRGVLGEGGLGTVYRALDATLGQEVALKVLANPSGSDAERLLFKQEYRALSRLHHPNLCAVHDFGFTPDGLPFFTMEIVPGQDLHDMIPLSPDRLVELLPQLGRALAYLHQHGLVHGDVKPENIRVMPDGTVKLMDLGFVRPAGEAPLVGGGTLSYMAPELIRRDRVDQRIDLYALGATCYTVLAGRPPFAGTAPRELLRAHLTRRPRPLREADPSIPLKLERFVAKLMASEPVARYASVHEALRALGLEVGVPDDATLLQGTFVGRAEHLARFERVLRERRADRKPAALWLAGPAGSGKTRLLDACRVIAQLEDLTYLAGPGVGPEVPYGSWVAIVRALLARSRRILDALSPEQRAALARIVPEDGEVAAVAALEPREERALILGAIAALLRAGLGEAGGVLALDDWDRADAASVEALAYVRRNLRGVPLVVVGTTLEPPGEDEALHIPPLGAGEVAALAASMLGSAELPSGMAAALMRWTGGHAGHVPRVVEHLVRTGALARGPEGWTARDGLAVAELGADMRELALAPLQDLSPGAMQLAELAAVVGTDTDVRMLADLLGSEEEAFLAALAELRAAHVLTVAEGRASLASEGLADALYERIPEKRRVLLHAAVASQLESALDASANDHARMRTALARHLLRSRQLRKALPAALLAADLAMAIFAVDAARLLLQDGLAAMAADAARLERARRDFLTRLAYVEQWRGDLDAMAACLAEALPLAERDGEVLPLARLLVLKAGLHIRRMTPADLRQALEDLARAGALDVPDEVIPVRIAFAQGQAHVYLGAYAEAREAFEGAARQAKGASLAFWRAKSLAFLGYLQATGDPTGRAAGFRRLKEAEAIQTRLGDHYGRGFTLALHGEALLQTCQLDEAEQAFDAQVAINAELGVTEDLVTGMANMVAVLALSGRYHEALEACAETLPLARQHGIGVGVLAEAIEAFARAGLGELARAEEALVAVEAAGGRAGGYMFVQAVPFLVEGWLRLGRADEARRIAEHGITLLGQQPNPAMEAHLEALLAYAHLRQGRENAARELATEAMRGAEKEDAPLARMAAARALAAIALHAQRLDEARAQATRLLELAEAAGARDMAAAANAMLGDTALRAGSGDAAARFRAVQAYADMEGVPPWRALALFGQSEAEHVSERANALALEAREILRSLADALKPPSRRAFLAMPEIARALESRLPERERLTLDSGPAVFDKIKTVSRDLLGFADQYGMLFREWIESTRRLEMLNGLARKINESLDLDEVLNQVVSMTLELTVAERAFVLLLDGDHLDTRMAADRTGRVALDARIARSICRRVLESGEALCVLDTMAENSDGVSQSSIAALDLRTLMCVPLTVRGQTLGLLYVDSQAVVTTFTRGDLELLQAIASHASVAIGNARLYQDTRQHSVELARALDMYRDAMQQANTDALTGLANRRCFEELAARELDATRRYGRHLSVIMLDVDHFKSFNDTYGHALGDAVLTAVADVLKAQARVCDVPARLGGEEFVVLCPETSPEVATVLAERIRVAVAAMQMSDPMGEPLRQITVSLGIAPFVDGDDAIARALERADQALYRCKRDGRNRHHVWAPGAHEDLMMKSG